MTGDEGDFRNGTRTINELRTLRGLEPYPRCVEPPRWWWWLAVLLRVVTGG